MAVWPNGSHTIPRVSSEFNMSRRNPVTGVVQPHWGIDLVGWSTIVSPVNGTIIYAGYNGGAGNEVRIRGDNGDVFRLLHNKSFIRTSGRVSEGTPVAIMGTTGQSTGVHCHFECKPGGGTAINPRTYMAQHGGAPANIGSGQRTAGPNGVKRRSQPTSQSPEAGEMLTPGTVGNFNGWIRGENVQGNNVWYRGISGHWFWSGGFVEGANGTGLQDLNPVVIGGNQRKVGPNGANGRNEPNTNGGVTQTLAPGTVGDFDGWIRGQVVEGNDIWFRGAHSGDWFWSGGFEGGGNTANLKDMNPTTPTTPTMGEKQRQADATHGANGRKEPKTSAEIVSTLGPGAVGDFDAWTKGEVVEGNDIWFRGAHSGAWFWSGGLNPKTTTGLTEYKQPDVVDPDPVDPNPTAKQRQVLPDYSANGRTGPYRSYNIVQSLPAGSIAEMDAWAEGEAVEGNNVWFRGASTKNWFWSGGFTSKSTADLTKVTFTPPLDEQRTPIYPKATAAYNTPNGSVRNAGSTIDKLYVHHCAATSDQLAYFRRVNERSSCPTFYVRTTGEVIELIPPKLRPWSTGQADHTALAIETQNTSGDPNWGISDESHEAIAQIAAWMSKQTEIDGVPVTFTLDRQHILGHREAPGAATACPGPSMDLNRIVARAIQIANETTNPDPDPDPEPDEELAALKESWEDFKAKMDDYLA